jgi:hypothetical protein
MENGGGPRRINGQPPGGPPPFAGAADLAQVKQNAREREQMERTQLTGVGALCPCGERVRAGGQRAWMFDRISNPGASILQMAVFCRRDCPMLLENAGRIEVLQDCPAFYWTDEDKGEPAERRATDVAHGTAESSQ